MTRLLLERVVSASLLILAVIALRTLLGRHISAGLRYALWAVVLVRLLVPLQFYSLPVPTALPEADREPVTTNAAPAATVPALQGEAVGAPVIAAPHPGGVAANYDATDTPSTAILDVTHLWGVLGWLWLAGAAIMTAAFFFSNLAFALRLRRVRVPLEGADCPLPVYLAENLPSPCLFGLVRPSVYVTAESTQHPAMLCHILAHEYTHFRHGDYVWNLLHSAALAIHWWNPLVWLAIILNRRDCELACDEGTLKRLGDDERIAYGRTLLALITVKPRPGDLLRCATTMTSGQKSVFDRITRIAHAPKRWLWAAVVVVITTALASVCAFGQATGSDFVDSPDLTADLTFSTTEPNGRIVNIKGTVGDFTVSSGTTWQPDPAYDIDLLGNIFVPHPPFSEENGMIGAWWADENRTSVTVTGQPLPLTSIGADYTGWRTFTVSLDGNSGSITESHTHGSEGNIYLASLSDEEAVTLARFTAKLLMGAEDYYQSHAGGLSAFNSNMIYDDTEELIAYRAVLSGNTTFHDTGTEKNLDIAHICEVFNPEIFWISKYFTIIDLDGDGIREVVLILDSAVLYGYEILHYQDGTVYGYYTVPRGFKGLKVDGTYEGSSSAFSGTVKRVESFSENGFNEEILAKYDYHAYDYNGENEVHEYFAVNGQKASSAQIESVLSQQRAKKSAEWYELPLKGFDGDPATTAPDLTDTVPVYALDEDGVRQEGDFSNSVELAVSDGKRLTLVMREPLDKQNGNSLPYCQVKSSIFHKKSRDSLESLLS